MAQIGVGSDEVAEAERWVKLTHLNDPRIRAMIVRRRTYVLLNDVRLLAFDGVRVHVYHLLREFGPWLGVDQGASEVVGKRWPATYRADELLDVHQLVQDWEVLRCYLLDAELVGDQYEYWIHKAIVDFFLDLLVSQLLGHERVSCFLELLDDFTAVVALLVGLFDFFELGHLLPLCLRFYQ